MFVFFARAFEHLAQFFAQLLHTSFQFPGQLFTHLFHFLEVFLSLSKCSAPLFEVLFGAGFRLFRFLFRSGFLISVVGPEFGWDFGYVIGKMRAAVFILPFINRSPGRTGL